MIGNNPCCGCMACAQVCPKHCIKMLRDDNGFWLPEVRLSECVKCNKCEMVCPILSRNQIVEDGKQEDVLLCANKDNKVMSQSSSGGIFAALATSILTEHGIVCGAAFSEDYKSVRHIIIDKENSIQKLLGSKYVQSEIGNCFKLIQENIEFGRKVLFCGTPCQVAALKNYLGKKRSENVLLVDFLCHGVPSQKVYSQYIKWIEERNKSKIVSVNFRSKAVSWKQFTMKIIFSNGAEYCKLFDLDPYGQAFVTNISLADVCYECPFRTESRVADLTLADAWGISDIHRVVKENKGASIIFVHNFKGKQACQKIFDNIRCEELSEIEIGQQRKRLTERHQRHRNREAFFAFIDSMDFSTLVKKQAPYSLKKEVRLAIKQYFGK